ncbi:MAG: ATP-dependent 6-phosphofructokinase [Bryobacteraceae bacterium]
MSARSAGHSFTVIAGVPQLGECRVLSPIQRPVPERILLPSARAEESNVDFERAGPRPRIYFDPGKTRAAIVTCGGLCPGMNNVLRSVFLELYHRYGVKDVFGIRYGYAGLHPANGLELVRMDMDFIHGIQNKGGTVLGSSRGPVNIQAAVDFLRKEKIDVLLCVGGDGTQRGALMLHQEAVRQHYPLAVVGIPKTVDNDIEYVWRTFGYSTAVEEAAHIIDSAHVEAKSYWNGIGLVKLMGREAGFLACGSTLASQEVNFTLVPEIPFALEGANGFLHLLEDRLAAKHHAVIVVAEGAAQSLIPGHQLGADASGNRKLKDSGIWLKERIETHFRKIGVPIGLKYFDPSYIVRSKPANKDDALLCDQYARNAVHAAMAGRTGVVIGVWYNVFVHVPIEMATAQPRRVAPSGEVWSAVLAATGQPAVIGEALAA